MRDLQLSPGFLKDGGTEVAPMSTSTDLKVALHYAGLDGSAKASLVLKLRTTSFMQRGADIGFLSAFPGEAELCFPPLTHLKPSDKDPVKETINGKTVIIHEVVPTLGTQ